MSTSRKAISRNAKIVLKRKLDGLEFQSDNSYLCPAAQSHVNPPKNFHVLVKLNLMKEARIVKQWETKARQLKAEAYALYLACRHPGVPWYAKAFAACVVGYLFSPIDLIPDFIPVLGYVDDLILVPLGITLALKMIPTTVWDECRQEAHKTISHDKPRNWAAVGFIIAIWILVAALVIVFVIRNF